MIGIIAEMMKINESAGYTGANLAAKVCQDIVLRGIAHSSLNVGIIRFYYDA